MYSAYSICKSRSEFILFCEKYVQYSMLYEDNLNKQVLLLKLSLFRVYSQVLLSADLRVT